MVLLIRLTPVFVICQSNRFDDHCFATSLTVFILYLMFELIECRVPFSNKFHNLPGRAGFSRIKSQCLSWLLIYLKYFENIQNISCYLADPCYNVCFVVMKLWRGTQRFVCSASGFRALCSLLIESWYPASYVWRACWLSSSCNGFMCVFRCMDVRGENGILLQKKGG
jgi:hypothetical protein